MKEIINERIKNHFIRFGKVKIILRRIGMFKFKSDIELTDVIFKIKADVKKKHTLNKRRSKIWQGTEPRYATVHQHGNQST